MTPLVSTAKPPLSRYDNARDLQNWTIRFKHFTGVFWTTTPSSDPDAFPNATGTVITSYKTFNDCGTAKRN